MKIGYLRVSTEDQSHHRQLDGMESHCDELHCETVSAVSKKRPVYQKVIRRLKAGDTFVIWSVDRAFRSNWHALREAEKLRKRGIEFQIVQLNIDTRTAAGRYVYAITAAGAEFERDFLIERTKEGMAAAKRRGKHIGRPFKLTPGAVSLAYYEIFSGRETITSMAASLGCSRDTLSKALRRFGLDI